MYFTKYHPIKEQLRERTLSERDGLPYYVIYMALWTWTSALPLESSLTQIDVVSAVLSTITAICGVIYCYLKNGGKSGYDFIKKSIVLGFIVMIRCILPFILIFFVVLFVKPILGYPINAKSWLDILVLVLIIAFYNWRLGFHVHDTIGDVGEPAPARDR